MKDLNDVFAKGVISQALSGKITNAVAASRLGISIRYVKKLKARLRGDPSACFSHGNKRRAPANKASKEKEAGILGLYLVKYNGFNFTHFLELIKEREGIDASYHQVYRILTDAGISSPDAQKRKRSENAHPSRARRSREGELVQIDASEERWFGPDRPKAAAHGAIDDATGKVLACYFDAHETLNGYLHMARAIFEENGMPEAFYGDNRTVFVYRRMSVDGLSVELDADTQFRRICKQLGIEVITTSVSQAKGRIERLWRTFQDRLVAEFRLNGISTIEEANAFMPGFIERYNARFSIAARDPETAWVEAPKGEDLDFYLSTQYIRKADNGSSFSLFGKRYQLINDHCQKVGVTKGVAVDFYVAMNGTITAVYLGRLYSVADAVEINGWQADKAFKEQIERKGGMPYKPGPNHPWKRFIVNYKYKRHELGKKGDSDDQG